MSASPLPSKTSETSSIEALVRLDGPMGTPRGPVSPTPPTSIRGSGKRDNEAPRRRGRGRAALKTFEETVGGRAQLRAALADASDDNPKCRALMQMLADPLRTRDALGTLAADAGMTIGQVIEAFRHATQARALVLATARMSEHLPAIVEDAALKAQDRDVPCRDCTHETRKDCKTCLGRGLVLREADFQRQKLFFEAGGLVKRGEGSRITLQQAIGLTPPHALFSKFVAATDDVAYDVEASP